MQANLLWGAGEKEKENKLAHMLEALAPRFTHTFGLDKAIGIDDVHEMHRRAALVPGEATQAFVIHRADEMTPEAAQALLKILEEPPASSHFFLLARSATLPQTILSRVAKFACGASDEVTDYFDIELGRLRDELHQVLMREKKVPHALVARLKKTLEYSTLASTSRIPPRTLIDAYDTSR